MGGPVMAGPDRLRRGDAEEAGMSAAGVRQVARLAESWVAQGMTPALVVLVARRGVVVLHEACRRRGDEVASGQYGYELLAEIVARVAGRSLPELARERIFEPLGLADSSYGLPEGLRDRVVRRPLDVGYGEVGTREFEQTTWSF